MARPRPAGRSLEARGNAGPTEMVATVFDGTEPGVQTGSSVLASLLSTYSHFSRDQVPSGCARDLVHPFAFLGPRVRRQSRAFLGASRPAVFVRMRQDPCHVRDELFAQEWGSLTVAGGVERQ